MKPEKAKIAITITVCVALLIVAICLFLLFKSDLMRIFGSKEDTDAAQNTPESNVTTMVPEVKATPSIDDLKGCSDELYYPKAESYLEDYCYMITRASHGETIKMLYKPEPQKVYDDVLLVMEEKTKVTGIAQENGYTLVLLKEGVAGWVLTYELEEYNAVSG